MSEQKRPFNIQTMLTTFKGTERIETLDPLWKENLEDQYNDLIERSILENSTEEQEIIKYYMDRLLISIGYKAEPAAEHEENTERKQ